MNTFQKMVSFSLIIISLSIGYYFVIFLPARDKSQLEFQKDKSLNLNKCLDDVKNNETTYWNSRCDKVYGKLKIPQQSKPTSNFPYRQLDDWAIDQDVKSKDGTWTYNTDKHRAYSLDYTWIWDDITGTWIPNYAKLERCLLPEYDRDKIASMFKEESDKCFKQFPQN